MEKFKNYTISFSGLSLGKHDFEFQLTQTFFDLFEFEQDFKKPDLNLKVVVDKKSNFLELHLSLFGTIELDCDLTSEPYDQNLIGNSVLIVKFGDHYDYTDDEVWVLPHGEHQLGLAQIFYEMTLLALPAKRIHPGIEAGTFHPEMLELLDKYSLHEPQTNKTEMDPRWETLKKIK